MEFPSPYGDKLHLQTILISRQLKPCFRPLTGISYITKDTSIKYPSTTSVPLAGVNCIELKILVSNVKLGFRLLAGVSCIGNTIQYKNQFKLYNINLALIIYHILHKIAIVYFKTIKITVFVYFRKGEPISSL